MLPQRLRRIYASEYLVKDELKLGDIPDTKTTYGTTMSIAWASIAESFLIALMSMADIIMVSVIGEQAIAAVGLVTQPRFIVQTLVLSLNVAITSLCARRKGAGDIYGACDCLKQGLVLSVAVSLVMGVAVFPFSRSILLFAGAQPDTIEMAVEYFTVILIGIPFCNISLTISSALRGIGQTRSSMFINMTANAVNLFFNFLLIEGNWGFPRLEVTGAAIATSGGWVVGFILAVLAVSHKQRTLFIFNKEGWRFEKSTLSAMYKITSGAFIEQICLRVGFLTYGKIIAGLGTIMYAAHQIMQNLMSLSFSFGEGYGIAASALVGQNLGAKRPDMSIVYGKACQRMSFISSTLILVLLTTLGDKMLLLFTREPEILAIAPRIMFVMALIIYGQSSQMIFMGSLRGAGDTRFMAFVSMFCVMFLRPVLAYILAYLTPLGLVGAWLAFLCDQYLRLFFNARRFSSGKWMAIKL